MKQIIRQLANEQQEMEERLTRWSKIPSSSTNLVGLAELTIQLKKDFKALNGIIKEVDLPPRLSINEQGETFPQKLGSCLHITKRQEAPFRLLFVGHMDTVLEGPNPITLKKVDRTLFGPGVVDMKGGLVIALHALKAVEQSPYASQFGWEFLINADEEIGSVGSAPLLKTAAGRCHIGLIFEPSLPDGKLVSSRKGSLNLTAIAKGLAAHAGRDYWRGRNAIIALADWCINADLLKSRERGITVNIGKISGGKTANQVADVASCQLNIRIESGTDLMGIEEVLKELTQEIAAKHKVAITVHRDSERPPKPLDAQTAALFQLLKECGREVDQFIEWGPSGGVCDGNILAAAGLPTIDTLGAIGGGLHTPDEYIEMDSLIKRAQLAALFIMNLRRPT